jgi:hypothetical protein
LCKVKIGVFLNTRQEEENMSKKCIAVILFLLASLSLMATVATHIAADTPILVQATSDPQDISQSASAPSSFEVLLYDFRRPYQGANVDVSTVLIEDVISPISSTVWFMPTIRTSYLDLYFDGNAITDIVLSKAAHININDEVVELKISGKFFNGKSFEGSIFVGVMP